MAAIYKIMLAEDEVEVLGAMLQTIRWEKYGFETPIGCPDGRAAIAALEDGFAPDVLITDICMPFVDGLELAAYIGKSLPETIVVILTGYDDFKYAQKAIKLKAFDYMLKPITPNALGEQIQKLKEELDARRLESEDRSMQIVASHFLNQLMSKRLDRSVIEENCRIHKFDFAGRYHTAVVLDVDLTTPETINQNNNRELMRYGLYNIAQELVAGTGSAGTMTFQGNDGTTQLIVEIAALEGAYSDIGALIALITQTVQDCLSLTVSAGVGEPVAYLDELHMSHEQALTALSYRFFYGEGSVICEADIDVRKSGQVDYAACERRFVAAAKSLDREKAYESVSELMTLLKDNRVAFDKCSLYSQKLMMSLITLTGDIVGAQEVESLEQLSEHVNFYAVSTIGQMEELIRSVCEKAFALLEIVKTDGAASQVIKAESYIRAHFNDPELSLNQITEHLAISTSYFSAIFKSKTGSTFVEYLTRVRMDKAKQILAFTDRRTYETAEDVGFTDPHYFSVAFKRVTGMTPKEYRECSRRTTA